MRFYFVSFFMSLALIAATFSPVDQPLGFDNGYSILENNQTNSDWFGFSKPSILSSGEIGHVSRFPAVNATSQQCNSVYLNNTVFIKSTAGYDVREIQWHDYDSINVWIQDTIVTADDSSLISTPPQQIYFGANQATSSALTSLPNYSYRDLFISGSENELFGVASVKSFTTFDFDQLIYFKLVKTDNVWSSAFVRYYQLPPFALNQQSRVYPSVTPDGRYLTYVKTSINSGNDYRIILWDTSTAFSDRNALTALATIEGNAHFNWCQFSKDGSSLFYWTSTSGGKLSRLRTNWAFPQFDNTITDLVLNMPAFDVTKIPSFDASGDRLVYLWDSPNINDDLTEPFFLAIDDITAPVNPLDGSMTYSPLSLSGVSGQTLDANCFNVNISPNGYFAVFSSKSANLTTDPNDTVETNNFQVFAVSLDDFTLNPPEFEFVLSEPIQSTDNLGSLTLDLSIIGPANSFGPGYSVSASTEDWGTFNVVGDQLEITNINRLGRLPLDLTISLGDDSKVVPVTVEVGRGVQVKAGWNLLGVPWSLYNETGSDFEQLGAAITWRFEASKYYEVSPTEFGLLTPGTGLWLYADSDSTYNLVPKYEWGQNTGFPVRETDFVSVILDSALAAPQTTFQECPSVPFTVKQNEWHLVSASGPGQVGITLDLKPSVVFDWDSALKVYQRDVKQWQVGKGYWVFGRSDGPIEQQITVELVEP